MRHSCDLPILLWKGGNVTVTLLFAVFLLFLLLYNDEEFYQEEGGDDVGQE